MFCCACKLKSAFVQDVILISAVLNLAKAASLALFFVKKSIASSSVCEPPYFSDFNSSLHFSGHSVG
jgi:hypothetical protein